MGDWKTIITIGREYGAGGRTVAKLLSDRLGIPHYDKEIITLAAEKSGLPEQTIRGPEQGSGKTLLSWFLPRGPMSAYDQAILAQANIIRKLAEEGPCIIVGRCADFILQDRTDCLKVFIHADMKFRADRIVRVYGEREKSPEARLKEKDKRRAAYYRFYTDMNWGNAANYHIALDSGVIGIEKSAEIIESLA